MLEKLIAIKNVGKFSRLNLKRGNWDGVLAKTNIIYAPNGSGKTTLSLVLQSLRGDPKLLGKKSTFTDLQLDGSEQVVILRFDGKQIEYRNGSWNQEFPNIEVFNIHFIESTLFTGSSQLRHNQHNLFTYLAGKKGAEKKMELDDLRSRRLVVVKKERLVKNRARKGALTKSQKIVELAKLQEEKLPILEAISKKNEEMGLYSQKLFQDFTEKVNVYLAKFSRSMRLEKISKELDQRTTFYLKFGSNRVTFNAKSEGHEFKYTLSEGDKNALSFSVFLAQVAFAQDPKDLLLVFDDPLTSLDSGRRFLTIKELSRLSETVGQLIVLTHDSAFAAELEREVRGSALSLELMTEGGESWLTRRDHQGEHITGLFRDIQTLSRFLEFGSQNQSEMRDIMRCLRPTLEGFVRIKYYDRLARGQWLGDFIGLVRVAPENDDLGKLKLSPAFDDLCAVNDYSKRFHHSSPSEPESSLDESELQIMVEKTLRLLKLL